ncbi:hypothetical protein R1flu_024164 [Riccia fluitans]|uniref:non-specific serine/threonine protein kinase n=1 Tax=Riccia fluitans TaxID=41844 RepID=A0ABD1XU35_9MARC
MFTSSWSLVWAVISILSFFTASSSDPLVHLGEPGSEFKCNPSGNIICWGGATTAGLEYLALYAAQNGTKTPLIISGKALWYKPILLVDSRTRRWDSFRTFFSFTIVPGKAGPGDGMTFVMLTRADVPGSWGREFGLYNESGPAAPTLAVEFDTFFNPGNRDKDNNHVGLDLKEITSVVARNASEVGINLSWGQRVYTWINYESLSRNLTVWISLSNFRPPEPFLQHEVNLTDIFPWNSETQPPYLYVGFTASNTNPGTSYSVYEWQFEVFPAPLSPPSKNHTILIAEIVGAAVFSLLLVLGILLLFLWRRRKSTCDSPRKLGKGAESVELEGISDNLRFSHKQLSAATNQFREESKLGEGGFGNVYRGVVPSTGVPVAVKKLNHDSKQGLKEFVSEVTIINQLRHRNIVRLLGWCSDRDKFLLVYEFMPNRSLDKALFHPTPGCVLPWKQRFEIIRGAAEALHYLHEGWRQQVIHRDFKSSNIMLDANFNAMLGDFGLARMVGRHQIPATTVVAGTYGYIAPEAHSLGKFTEKTDVYAFGAVALEVACGRSALNLKLPEDERVLVDWVWKKLEEDLLMSVVDPRLEETQYDAEQVQMLLLVGLLCSHPNPHERLSMRQVLEVLSGAVDVPPVPLSKPVIEYQTSGLQFRMKGSRSTQSRDMGTRTFSRASSGSSHRQEAPFTDPSINFSLFSRYDEVQEHKTDSIMHGDKILGSQ